MGRRLVKPDGPLLQCIFTLLTVLVIIPCTADPFSHIIHTFPPATQNHYPPLKPII